MRINFEPFSRSYFALRKDSLWAKIKGKTDEILIKYQNPNKIFHYF